MPYEAHPELHLPPDDIVLWRYMDFASFVQMLETQTLWFSRADQFEDPLEGTYTDAEMDYLISLAAQHTGSDLPNPTDLLRSTFQMRATVFANCWRMGAGESLAMWDLYGKGNGIIAVKTTIGALKEAIAQSGLRTFLGEVIYLDWSIPAWHNNGLVMCFRKDSSYKHEAELRAIIWDVGLISQIMDEALASSRLRADYPQSSRDPFFPEKTKVSLEFPLNLNLHDSSRKLL